MAITLQEIQDEGFEHSLRGYDVGQVDVFLERVGNEVDAMNKRIAELEEELEKTKNELDEAKSELAECRSGIETEPVPTASDDESEDSSLIERELRSELEIVKGRLTSMTLRAEEAEAKLTPMQDQLEEKNKLDNAIAEAFISAQRSAAQIKEEAREEGDRIYRESEEKAREFIRESLARKAAIDAEIESLKECSQNFRTQYLNMLDRFATHAKEEFAAFDGQSVTDAQIEAELPDMRSLSSAQPENDAASEEDAPLLTTERIPEIKVPSVTSDVDDEG